MLIRVRKGWELDEGSAVPEAIAFGRRHALAATGALAASLAGSSASAEQTTGAKERFPPERAVTPEKDASSYNNYYEFSSGKSVTSQAQRLPQRPWTVQLDGLVESPASLDLDALLKKVSLEDRVLRHRCVEGWAMTVPWTGFPMAELVRMADPKPEARYVVFESIAEPAIMPGLRQVWYPWPYREGCTIAEAMNEMCFLATGMYGKPVPAQNGGPIRVLFPWKYGFKSSKAVVKITFTDRRPVSFWEKLQPQEYGFWANVNPEVAHPRWSQASERLLGSGDRVPTRLYNGYGEFVAHLYKDLATEKLYF
ncbi:protein-methionine-sulfoxide reductase catalytic subunit MsrP [Pseudoroseomonas globiformis]|uniref:Protein-methionine-sulfoxide reductase catalytic subunit MsrP n=1 Tax=Teichococcus globiformis TaxID=2307229 RepID=A0ABV7G1R3_9PROT